MIFILLEMILNQKNACFWIDIQGYCTNYGWFIFIFFLPLQ